MIEEEHFIILLDDIIKKFDAILDGHVSLNKIGERGYGNLNIKVELNGMKIDALNRKLQDLDARRSGKIDELREEILARMESMAADLAAHQSDMVSRWADHTASGPGNLKGGESSPSCPAHRTTRKTR